MNTASPVNALFYKPELTIGNPEGFEQVRSSIHDHFSAGNVKNFLASVDSRKTRIRDFESVLDLGLLGQGAIDIYKHLDNGDQGQIREFYLASLERVSPELRTKFFKLYSYY